MTAATEKPEVKSPAVPQWALIGGVVVLAIGLVIGLTRETRVRKNALRILNSADIRMVTREDNKPILDGFAMLYGHVALMNQQQEYDEILGLCTTHPQRAILIFRDALQTGSWQGKALACHMAFYLAQENALTREDVEAMVGLLSDPSEELRRVAQRELGYLLVVRNSEKVKAYEHLGPVSPNAESTLSAKIDDVEMPVPVKKGEWKRMFWSSAEACQAWWKAYGTEVKWDPMIRRFAIGG